MVENKHVHAPDTMESLLQEIGLGYVAGKFKEEKVGIGVATSATEKDLIKLGARTICRRRNYDTTNNNTDGCGSYSYTTTTKSNTTSSMQTLGREEKSFLFFPTTYGNNGHRSSSSRRTSSSTTTRKNAQKKSQVQFMCLSDRTSDKIPNPTQKQVLQKAGFGLKKIVFDLEDNVVTLNYYGVYLTVDY